MSTILKALEKSKHQSQTIVIDKSMGTSLKLMMVVATLLIVILLAVIILLLYKPTEGKVSEPAFVAEVLPLGQNTPVINNKPVSLVSEMSFQTVPLPKTSVVQITQQKSVSAETSTVNDISKSMADNTPDSNAYNDLTNSLELEHVSSDLQRKFALAVELEQGEHSEEGEVISEQSLVAVSDISTMPATFQYLVPVMRYDSHMYSSEAKNRWIRINGVDLRVGDYIGAIELLDILPQQSVFRMGKQSFTLESLQDWKG